MDTFNRELLARLEAQRQARQAGDASTKPDAGEAPPTADSRSEDSS
jgi:hypothetical protein